MRTKSRIKFKCSLINYLMNSHESRDELHHHDLHLKTLIWTFQLLQELLCKIWITPILITNLGAFIESDSRWRLIDQPWWVSTCNLWVFYTFFCLTLWIMDQVDGREIKNFHFFLLFMFLRKPHEICTLSNGISNGHYSALKPVKKTVL